MPEHLPKFSEFQEGCIFHYYNGGYPLTFILKYGSELFPMLFLSRYWVLYLKDKFTPYEIVFASPTRIPSSEPIEKPELLPTYNGYIV